MKQLSAADAYHRFSMVLDDVEAKGESYVIVRHGRAVATIGPVGGGNGKALKEALSAHPSDESWMDELRKLRENVLAL